MTDVGELAAPSLEIRVLEAAKVCCERYGIAKMSIDDVAAAARVSRATIYRLYPGGKDVLLEAMRVWELEQFFERLRVGIQGADTLEDLLVSCVVTATRDMRDDEHLALMLASQPGVMLTQMTSEGVPRIVRMATTFLVPFADPFLTRDQSTKLIDVLARLTISYFLAPSDVVDLGDPDSARAFLVPLIATLTQGALTP